MEERKVFSNQSCRKKLTGVASTLLPVSTCVGMQSPMVISARFGGTSSPTNSPFSIIINDCLGLRRVSSGTVSSSRR
ncbi:hypothetical protein LIPSTDRAFT_71665 [Lipomyces starkeyi NRRL Y-11557]|uniref:Uncharacterized protein n=1 Tax=Lipomyces starkeyi NRRL Y-11557 TaxID=675824 RepID=A0A1E3Q6S6_LIPST|nr:hypothetical protein LIPSTDRAFT_71665 [Lipomyces starkeyi NRRL Y-11557]